MAILQALPLTLSSRSNGGFRGVLSAVGAMWRAAETRRQLAQLDARMLADIGLGRAEALAEADRAPWDLAKRRR